MKISEVPMQVDGKDVIINEIFYKANPIDMGHQYQKDSFSGRGEVEIEPWRVISTNNSVRHFRLRNASGCEVVYSLKDGCICENIYSTIEQARIRVKEIFQNDINAHDQRLRKMDKVKSSKAILVKKQAKVSKQKATKLPKKV